LWQGVSAVGRNTLPQQKERAAAGGKHVADERTDQ